MLEWFCVRQSGRGQGSTVCDITSYNWKQSLRDVMTSWPTVAIAIFVIESVAERSRCIHSTETDNKYGLLFEGYIRNDEGPAPQKEQNCSCQDNWQDCWRQCEQQQQDQRKCKTLLKLTLLVLRLVLYMPKLTTSSIRVNRFLFWGDVHG